MASPYLWRRLWWPTPVLLPGKSLGQRSLAGSSPWGCKELDTTEQLSTHTLFLFQAWRIWAQKAKQRQQLWCGNTKYYLGPFSTRGAMYASLSPSFLTPWRVLSPSSGIPFHVSLLFHVSHLFKSSINRAFGFKTLFLFKRLWKFLNF